MAIPQELQTVIVSDPEILGGTPCFVGTHVPLATFLDHVEVGYSLDRFLRGSSVHRDQAQAVLGCLSNESRQTEDAKIVWPESRVRANSG